MTTEQPAQPAQTEPIRRQGMDLKWRRRPQTPVPARLTPFELGRLRREKAIALTAAAKLLAGEPTRQTLVRWATHGFRGVVLETYKVGRKLYTSAEACERFIKKCTSHTAGQNAGLPASQVVDDPVATETPCVQEGGQP